MSSLWSSKPAQKEQTPETEPEIDEVDNTVPVAEPTAMADEDEAPEAPPAAPLRPLLRRDAAQPLPENDAPQEEPQLERLPALAMQLPNDPGSDSLSLAQLRQLVGQVNKVEPLIYDFEYADTGPHAEEIDEWFAYQFWQWVRLNAAQKAFEWHWTHESGAGPDATWDDVDHETRTRFVKAAIAGVQSSDATTRATSIGKLVYLVLGRWGDTAMPNATDGESRSIASIPQLQAIKAGVECLTSLEGLPVIWAALRAAFELQW